MNPSTTSGWKINNCVLEKNDQLFKCMEKNAYFVRDILISKENQFKPVYEKDRIVRLFSDATNQSIEIQTYYVTNSNGLAHILKPEAGVITKNISTTLNIDLNMNMSYFVLISDPKISIPSVMTDTLPRFMVRIGEGAGTIFLNIKVLAIYDLIPFKNIILHDSPYDTKIITGPKAHVKKTVSTIFHIVLRRALWAKQAVDLIGIDLTWRIYHFVRMLQLCNNMMMHLLLYHFYTKMNLKWKLNV